MTKKKAKASEEQRGRGRPVKLDAATPAILASVRRGLSYRSAAANANISYQTLRNWIIRAENEIERVAADGRRRIRADELPYVEFYKELGSSMAMGELANADAVYAAGQGKRLTRETRTTTIIEGDRRFKAQEVIIERETPPDWRASAFILERRYGWVPAKDKGRDEFLDSLNWDELTDQELERIADGDDPLVVLASRPIPSQSSEDTPPAAEEDE